MTASTATTVQYLNLAYFGRPADPASLTAFPATGMTDEQIVEAFVKTNEYSTNTLAPSTNGSVLNQTSLINTFYQRLFGRLAVASEVTGWTNAIATGAVNEEYLGITIMRAGLNLPVDTEMRKVLVAKFDSAEAFTAALSNDPASAQAYSTSAAADSAASFLTAVTTSTAATASAVATAVTDMVGTGNVGSTFALTTSSEILAGTAKNDTFSATDATLGAFDTLDGGAGVDTLAISHTSGAAFTAPAAKVSNVEIVDVTNQTGASAGTAETATVVFQDLGAGQSVSLAGVTFTASASGATAAQVAAAFVDATIATTTAVVAGGSLKATGGAAAAADTRAEVDALILAAGYTIADGADANSVVLTAAAVGNKQNIQAAGTAVTGASQSNYLTFATNPGNADNTLTLSVNGTQVTSKVAGSGNAAGLKVMVDDLAVQINAALGKTVAFSDGKSIIHIVSDEPLAIGDYAAQGTNKATTMVNTFGNVAETITVSTNSSNTNAATFVFNGVSYTTATLAGVEEADVASAITTKLNEVAGKTIATLSGDTVVIDNGGQGYTISNFATGGGSTFASSSATASVGYVAAAAPSITYSDGTAAVTQAAATTTVDVSKIGGATEAASVLSTGTVNFTQMTDQKAVVEGNGSLTNGTTTFTYKATATSTDVEVQNGVTAGDITLSAASATSSTFTSKGAANVVGTVDLSNAVTATVDAQSKLTATGFTTATSSSAQTLTITGTGAASIGTLDADFDTVSAAANSGGLTAAIGDNTDTVLTGSAGNDKITAATTNTIAATEKLSVDAGAGTDTLVIAASNDVDTASIGARYTNFEALEVVASQDASLVTGISSITAKGDSIAVSGLNSTNAVNITARDDASGGNNVVNALGLAFKVASGKNDVASISVVDKTATQNVSLTALDVNGIETVNVDFSTGTSGTYSELSFAANQADMLKALNITGSADVHLNLVANTLDVVATTIDASALTGKFKLTDSSTLVAGSKVISTSQADTIAAGDAGVTYQTGAGKDAVTTTAALILADGINDTVIDGGSGVDTLTVSTAAATLTDSHFTKVSNFEKLTTSGTGNTSVSLGTNFANTFQSGLTYTTGTLADGSTLTFNGGLYTGDVKLTSVSSAVGDGAAEDITIVTGSGSDTISFTAAAFVGHAATNATISITSGAGNDSIYLETGTIVDSATNQAFIIDAGTGKDTIELVKVNAANATKKGFALITVDAGDSLTSSYDVITGFDKSDGTDVSDTLDFTGNAAISDFSQSVNSGVIKSHSISAGIVTFDDTETFDTALVIGSSNLSDVIGYLVGNTANLDTIAFAYDTSGNGTADSTFVYNNNTVDSLVLLQDVTLGSLVDAATSATSGAGTIA